MGAHNVLDNGYRGESCHRNYWRLARHCMILPHGPSSVQTHKQIYVMLGRISAVMGRVAINTTTFIVHISTSANAFKCYTLLGQVSPKWNLTR